MRVWFPESRVELELGPEAFAGDFAPMEQKRWK